MGPALADGAHLAPAPRAGLIAERLTAQLLAGKPASSVLAVAKRLLAVQGQDARGVRLAIRARSRGLSAADVDRALTEERSVVIDWLNRGTLHLVASEDHAWLHSLTAPGLRTSSETRLAQEGLAPAAIERALAVIERSLASDGPLTRAQLAERLARAKVRVEAQAIIQLLFAACLRGVCLRGPMVGRQHAYVLRRDWLGEPKPPEREAALKELALRYLVGHGPGDDRDLARWSGLPLRDARAGLASLGRALRVREDGLLELKRAPVPAELPPARLLGAFDPLLLGWCSRLEILGSHQPKVTVGGVFRSFALVEGRGVATWKIVGKRVVLDPFGRLSAKTERALQADGEQALAYLQIA
jgi:hypothetical protein